jgi:hypothetical protein
MMNAASLVVRKETFDEPERPARLAKGAIWSCSFCNRRQRRLPSRGGDQHGSALGEASLEDGIIAAWHGHRGCLTPLQLLRRLLLAPVSRRSRRYDRPERKMRSPLLIPRVG